MREYSRMHMLVTEVITSYTNKPVAGGNIDGLLASGAISADDATYLREHQVQFYGFDPVHNGADVRVFETICTNTKPPRRIVSIFFVPSAVSALA